MKDFGERGWEVVKPIVNKNEQNMSNASNYRMAGKHLGWGLATSGVIPVRGDLGRVTVYEYDAEGRDGSFEYNKTGKLVVITDALGSRTRFEYDAAGRLVKAIDPLGGSVTYEYDSRGLKTKETGHDNRSVFYAYDAAGRLVSSRDGAENITRRAYDSAGNLASKTDARGNAATFEYDAMSRLARVTDAEWGVWRYAYDAGGRLAGITDANGRARTFEYDGSGRLITIIDALGGRTGFEYDAVGNMTRLRKPTGEAQEYVYDAGNRLTSAKAGAETWNFTWNSDDLLAGFSGGGFAMSYDYDAGHRLTKTGYDSLGKALLYVYDAVGNRTKLVREDTSDVNYAYDALNRLTEINEHNRKYQFTYDPAGRLTQRTYPNGIVSGYAYDPAGRLERLEHRKADSVLLGKFNYTYDPNGNKTAVTDSVGKYDYTYDKLDRLTKAVFPSGRTQEFTYDHAGNRTKLTQLWPEHLAKANGIAGTPVNGTVSETITYAYDEADHIVSAGDKIYTHDATGKLTRIQAPPNITTIFDYDGFDRPVRITGLKDALTGAALPTNEFAYAPLLPSLSFTPAPLGSRLKKTDSQGVAQYLVDNTGNVLAELDANKAIKKRYLHTLNLDEPLPMTDEHNHTYYMLPDGLGSVSMLTDSLGDPVQNYHYEPYGKPNVTARDKNPYKFTSREYDIDTQHQYSRARYYDPALGRWLTPDPLINYRTAEYYSTENLQVPVTLNPCSYGRCNPIKYTDPMGLLATGGVPLPVRGIPNFLGDDRVPKLDSGAGTCADKRAVEIGDTVYRVYGGVAQRFFPSWTDKDPRTGYKWKGTTVGPRTRYRIEAGLPDPPRNTGERMVIGTIKATFGIIRIPGGAKKIYDWREGGWPELKIYDAGMKVKTLPENFDLIFTPPF